MKILVINSGSSSLKFQLLNTLGLSPVISGMIDRIGAKQSKFSYTLYRGKEIVNKIDEFSYIKDTTDAFKLLIDMLQNSGVINASTDLTAIGHRVVHGGDQFNQPVLITGSVLDSIRKNIPLAPLHNPANLKGIDICRETFPAIPQVAVFDTAFHQTMPEKAYRYPLENTLYGEHKIRRYGFHGTSHQYVANCAAQVLDKSISQLNLITLHLGNGASAAAIQAGQSVDTSMGMTPLEGLMMGTRCGDIDPGIIFYLARTRGLDFDEIDSQLNRQSGFYGICGLNDMREIQQQAEHGEKHAKLAIEMYCYRIKKYIGAYFAILGRLDGLVFTAGIGENSQTVRLLVCQGLEHFGIHIDPKKNNITINSATEIQTNESPVKILVVPTNEETEIARQTLTCI